ncbi:MAG: glycine cleavage system protein H [Thermoplasmata archaeon HGW-Thermoplasmata-1]|nr:MAG: glycine cleavage system protein H [Thermoplasmata archaeon HGW-Thermoplasmata-1]
MADSEVRKGYLYTKSHEWLKVDGKKAKLGITDHAQKLLTDVVFLELPDAGAVVGKGDEVGVVESVKSVSEIYTPISGKITAVNSELEDAPEKINESPYEEGWLVEIEMKDESELGELLDAAAYEKIL